MCVWYVCMTHTLYTCVCVCVCVICMYDTHPAHLRVCVCVCVCVCVICVYDTLHTCVLQLDAPSPAAQSRCSAPTCQKRPIICRKRPFICRKRPIMCQKRPVMCRKRPIMCQKRPVMCQKRPNYMSKEVYKSAQRRIGIHVYACVCIKRSI